jgi:hypothetical protein
MLSSSKAVGVNYTVLDQLLSVLRTDSSRSLGNKQQIKPLLPILVGEAFQRNWLKKTLNYISSKSLRMLGSESCRNKVAYLMLLVQSSRILGARWRSTMTALAVR